MSGRSRWHRPLACALVSLLANASLAQRLQFPNDEPRPGTGAVSSRLAAEARTQFDAMREQAGASATREAKQAYLAAAGVLLETGDAKGVGGSFLVAAGTVMMRECDGVFALLDAPALDDGAARLLASDLSLIVQQPPATSGALDRLLRDAFASLLQTTRPPGAIDATLWPWPETADAPPPLPVDATRLGDQAEPLATLQARCASAQGWIAYRPASLATLRLIVDASWPLGREKQVPAGVARRWRTELSRAAEEALGAGPTDGPQSPALLSRLAVLGRTFTLLDALAPDPGARQLEKALLAAVEVMPDDAGQSAGWVKLERWIRLATDRAALTDEKAVVRQLRPALRAVGDLARAAQSELFESLARVAGKPDASGDPGVMAAVTLFSESMELLKVLHRASDAVADAASAPGDPVARDNAKPYTDGLLKLSKDVADPRQRDRTLAALRNLATDVSQLLELPGEKRLREKDPELDAIAGGRGADVLAIIDRERLVWRKSVGAVVKPGANSGGEGNAARLHAIAIVLALAIDVAECNAIVTDRQDRLEQWGGWWLEDAALEHLAEAAAKAVPGLIRDVEAAQATSVLAEAQRGVRAHALVSLAARLSRALVALDPAPPTQIPLRGIRSIATGSPDPGSVAFARLRDRLGMICVYAQEGAAGNDEALRFATLKAAECLEELNKGEEKAP